MRILRASNGRQIGRALLFIVCAALFARHLYSGANAEGALDEGDATGYFIGAPPTNTGVIIFVHGLTGDGVGTWTASRSKAYWPQMLREDPNFAGYDVYVVQYPTPRFDKSYSIDELSDVINSQFQASGVTKYNKIIFIAHSMGGIIVRSLLLKHRNLMDKTRYIYFYATPGAGSYLAYALKAISDNPQAHDLMELSNNTYLSALYNAWNKRDGSRPPCFCAYEVLATGHFNVVTTESARALCSEEPAAIRTDHISIVKPEATDGRPYLVFKNAFDKIEKGVTE
jgi:pimeloyl-ACP methyl ester carboxylesterase